MTEKIIDSKTGQLKLSNEFVVCLGTASEKIVDHFGQENLYLNDMGNGWKHYTARNIQVNDTYFIITFYFEADALKRLSFIVSPEYFTEKSWDDWSEQEELKNQKYYERWLTDQLGNTRQFPWGVIGSFYDMRGGSSSIVLRYE